ncbi:MAG: hypothetical protein R3A52_27090 [Polyangiales bacterium]
MTSLAYRARASSASVSGRSSSSHARPSRYRTKVFDARKVTPTHGFSGARAGAASTMRCLKRQLSSMENTTTPWWVRGSSTSAPSPVFDATRRRRVGASAGCRYALTIAMNDPSARSSA